MRFKAIARPLETQRRRSLDEPVEEGKSMLVLLALAGTSWRAGIPGLLVGTPELGDFEGGKLRAKCHQEDRDRPKPGPDSGEVGVLWYLVEEGGDTLASACGVV